MGSALSSGIYAIVHPPSGRPYIGSSRDIIGRWAGHQKQLQAGTHGNSHLQRAWGKYGRSAFRFIILEHCHISELLSREQFWIDQTQAANKEFGFNLSPMAHAACPGEEGRRSIAESNRRRIGKPWRPSDPEAWKAKISASRTGKKYGPRDLSIGQKIAASLKGQPLSEERKAKISAAHTGKVRGPQSAIHRQRIAESNMGKRHSEATRQRIREIHRARSPEVRAAIGAKISATKRAKRAEVR